MPMPAVEEILQGKRRAIARQISRLENGSEGAIEILARLYPHTGQAHRIGVTGAPGTGKSTLVNRMAQLYRQQEKTVAVLSIDPTSPFSGGAILGDRIRLTGLSGDPGLFVRSMATRGSLGGLARAAADAITVFDAAGFEIILVETVGVGQAEVEIARLAHSVIVVEAPGLGDDVQAIKAGILEIADIFVVNKADRPGVEQTVSALRMMLELAADQAEWQPPLCKTVATTGLGVEDLLHFLAQHRASQLQSGSLAHQERARLRHEIEQILRERLLAELLAALPPAQLERLIEQVSARQLDPYTAAERLLEIRRTS